MFSANPIEPGASFDLTAVGQLERFPRPSPSGCYRLGQATFVGMHGNGRDAPLPVVRGATIEPLRSAPKRTFPRNYPGTSPDPEPAALARSEHGFWFMTGPGLARIKGCYSGFIREPKPSGIV